VSRTKNLIKSDSPQEKATASERCMHQHKSVCGESHANPRMLLFRLTHISHPSDLKFEFVPSSSALRQTSQNTAKKGKHKFMLETHNKRKLIFMDAVLIWFGASQTVF